MQQFAAAFMPGAAPVIELYAGARPILDLNGVEEEIAKALDRKVPLKSGGHLVIDRKSTRLNSSHSQISYAVFCLKKKKPPRSPRPPAQRRRPASQPPPGPRPCRTRLLQAPIPWPPPPSRTNYA